MKNSRLYYSMPTVRKARRIIRRACQKTNKKYGKGIFRVRATYRDCNGANILKTRRWRNRLMITKTI